MRCTGRLPALRRLKVRADISRAMKFGHKFQGRYLSLVKVPPGVIRPKPGELLPQEVRFAVLVKKACGRAVKRNRLKRLTREFFRLNQQHFQNCQAVVFSLERAVEDEAEFKRELWELARQAFPEFENAKCKMQNDK